MGLQDSGQQRAIAAADVHDGPEPAEVVGAEDGPGHRSGLIGHRLVEHDHLGGVVRHLLEALEPGGLPGLASLHRPIQLAQRAPEPLAPVQRHTADRSLGVRAEEPPHRGQLEPAVLQPAGEAEHGHGPQQAEQRARVRPGLFSKGAGLRRARRQPVRQAQPNGHVDHLGAPAGRDQLGQAGAFGGIVHAGSSAAYSLAQ